MAKKSKKKEIFRLEACKGIVTANGKIIKDGSEVFIEYNSRNIIPAKFLGFNKLSALYEFERQSITYPNQKFKLRMREMQVNDRKIYVEV